MFRVFKTMTKKTRATYRFISYTRERVVAERISSTSNRRGKTWIFIFLVIFMWLFLLIAGILEYFFRIYFKSLILLKNVNIGIGSFMTKLETAIGFVVAVIFRDIPFVAAAARQLLFVYGFLADFKIDFAAVGISCYGALKPSELLVNILVLCFVILIVESDVQLFRELTQVRVHQVTSQLYLENAFISWAFRERGTKLKATWKGVMQFLYLCVQTYGGLYIFSFDAFQGALLFAMSLVSFGKFFNIDAVSLDDVCNEVRGFPFMDYWLFMVSLLTLSLLLLPISYEFGKIVVPGIPTRFVQDGTMPATFTSHAGNKKDTHGKLRWSKYLSIAMPDLWWAYFVDLYLEKTIEHTPLGTKFDAPSLSDAKMQAVDGVYSDGDFLHNLFDKSFPKAPYLEATMTPPLPHFRIQTQVAWAGYKAGKGKKSVTLLVQKCKGMIVDEMIWDKPLLELPIQVNYNYGTEEKFVLVQLSRITGQVIGNHVYNADAKSVKLIVPVLRSKSEKDVVIFFGLNIKSAMHDHPELLEALKEMGSSEDIGFANSSNSESDFKFKSSKDKEDKEDPKPECFFVLGCPGADADTTTSMVIDKNTNVDVCFYLRYFFSTLKSLKAKSRFSTTTSQSDSGLPFVMNEKWAKESSILLHALDDRTEEENWQYEIRNLFRAPCYLDLCQVE